MRTVIIPGLSLSGGLKNFGFGVGGNFAGIYKVIDNSMVGEFDLLAYVRVNASLMMLFTAGWAGLAEYWLKLGDYGLVGVNFGLLLVYLATWYFRYSFGGADR